jgi:glycosyltransferase involved in cell wall biosynthesis
VRVTIADPPAYTPPYDHALAAGLARAGVEVELLTSHFRFGTTPAAAGYTLRESLYPVSARLNRHHLRVAAKAAEHPFTLARLASCSADIVHLQWVPAPEVDSRLLRVRKPLVFTAHDLLPRRTRHRRQAWSKLFARFDRIVTHSERGHGALVELGVDASKLHVIPHPVFRGDVRREDDGNTVLALGVIRPYKGLDDAVSATLGVDGARLLVAGDPRLPLEALRAMGGDRVEWRLGYLAASEMGDALAESTVAVFPYAAELDQSGALLQALGAGVPAVVYDVGGLGEVVRAFDAGRVVPAGDVAALREELSALLHDSGALAQARAGAERARDTLTWDAAAAAHIAVYEEMR